MSHPIRTQTSMIRAFALYSKVNGSRQQSCHFVGGKKNLFFLTGPILANQRICQVHTPLIGQCEARNSGSTGTKGDNS